MSEANKDLPAGFEIEPMSWMVTREKIATYSRYVFNGRDTRNIHTDDEVARRAGLPGAVAQGRYPISYLSERAMKFFGDGWVRGGRLDVALVKPIFPGDTVTARGVIRERLAEGGATRLILDMWLENQDGVRVTAGTASGLAPGVSQFPARDIATAVPQHVITSAG